MKVDYCDESWPLTDGHSLGEHQQEPLSTEESRIDPHDGLSRIQQDIDYLRLELDGERELLQQHIRLLVQQNLSLAQYTREQLDLWVHSV